MHLGEVFAAKVSRLSVWARPDKPPSIACRSFVVCTKKGEFECEHIVEMGKQVVSKSVSGCSVARGKVVCKKVLVLSSANPRVHMAPVLLALALPLRFVLRAAAVTMPGADCRL